MPGYGLAAADEGAGLLPWSWAVERLVSSERYWVATVGGGRPHLMPVWGLWLDDRLWFSSSPGSRKSRNLAASDVVTVATDDPRRPVVVEGRAVRVATDDVDALAAFTDGVNAKYTVDYEVSFYAENAVFAVEPTVVIGLDEDDFTGSPTRWRFDASGCSTPRGTFSSWL